MVDNDQEKIKQAISKREVRISTTTRESRVFPSSSGISNIQELFFTPKHKEKMSRKKAVVVVLGDIGRSPRMCYHAHSLATQMNHDVTIVGYLDSTPHSMITANEHITIKSIKAPPAMNGLPEAVQLLIKLIWTALVLFVTLLLRIGKYDILLMQNPPAIPTAPVCWIVSRLKGALFIIDWHNYMYSILRDKYNLQNLSFERTELPSETAEPPKDKKDGIKKRKDERVALPVTVKKKEKFDRKELKSFRQRYVEKIYTLEGWFGRRADGGLCVTKAMQKDLWKTWMVPSAVFYDRPPSWTFGNVTDKEKHDLFMRLGQAYQVFGVDINLNANNFTEVKNGKVIWKDDRSMIVMSSTSWTPDEDFSILLEAVVKYNDVARLAATSSLAAKRLPSILLVITGKGPLKTHYMDKISRLNMDKVKVITPWLEAADYPKMLAAADVGVSLHTSTSGLDLPMKVVDMFGSGIPVLAKNFQCISELVEDQKNGYLFDSPKDLFDRLVTVATGFPNHCDDLLSLKHNVTTEKLATWEETWPTTVAAVLTSPENMSRKRILASEPDPNDAD